MASRAERLVGGQRKERKREVILFRHRPLPRKKGNRGVGTGEKKNVAALLIVGDREAEETQKKLLQISLNHLNL